ncbi:MAG: rod shape-determining protein MreD [Candidatus Omnitrophica bacterium CG11_big_fil_rev_8_21_14_0_20_42_13]|uniref:Rod shape-determining protein MreD n=1 Tax=Candidatus Ghiorseimicrobium undicola TaxID=1974746 RepID=A0A2H0LXB1_9BACT|nr:MAG: rod shape-determining protein MreD [Candidatus Omnitrophica bacterium CG11_big_fil_rev_8_21_14_0_20_42_13]
MIILYILLCLVFGIVLPPNLFLFNVRPDIFLILVVFAGLFGLKKALFIAFLCGMLKDAVSSAPFGANIFYFTLWVLISDRINKHLYKDNRVLYLLIVVLATIGDFLLHILLNSLMIKGNFAAGRFLFLTLFVEVIYNILFAYILFDVFKKAARGLFV